MLTEKRIRDAKPGAKTTIIWDDAIKGLGLRVLPSGTRAFVLSYRTGGRKRLVTLARAGEIPLREVRELAGRELSAIRNDQGDPLQRRRAVASAPTVADGVARFFDEYAPRRMADGRLTDRTLLDYRKQADLTLLPALGRHKIRDVTRADIERAVAPRGPVQRNRTIALASRLFNLFEDWGWREAGSNPARRIEKARENPRDRVLSPTELEALAKALTAIDERYPAPVAAIRVLTLTGLRVGEVRAIRWEHVDFETGRLTMPATKTGPRVHDLPAAALAVLAHAHRLGDWAFMTGRGTPVSYRLIHLAFQHAAKTAGLEGVRLHDLRRTVMTTAAAAGVGTHVLRDLLGHRTAAMADRYIRALGNPVRDAREQVGAQMAKMMAGKSGEVVPLRRRVDG